MRFIVSEDDFTDGEVIYCNEAERCVSALTMKCAKCKRNQAINYFDEVQNE